MRKVNNVPLKDDKTFPYVKINWQDPFPKIEVTRTMRRDGARYFGPYTNARAIHRTLEGIRRIFPYLDCDRRITGEDERPCLYYYLKMCGGPCIGAQGSEQYRDSLRQMMRFLRGDMDQVMRQLRVRMEQAAERIVGQQVLIGVQPDNEDCITIVPDPDRSRPWSRSCLCAKEGWWGATTTAWNWASSRTPEPPRSGRPGRGGRSGDRYRGSRIGSRRAARTGPTHKPAVARPFLQPADGSLPPEWGQLAHLQPL